MTFWKACALAALVGLTACDSLPDWITGAKQEIKRTPGERLDVVFSPSRVTPDSAVEAVPIDIPEQTNVTEWLNQNAAMHTPHIGLTGIEHAQHVRIGAGVGFSRAIAPSPIVIEGKVLAMDASGTVAAYEETNLDHELWVNNDGKASGVNDVLGGGLAVQGDSVGRDHGQWWRACIGLERR